MSEEETEENPAFSGRNLQAKKAIDDIKKSVLSYHLWGTLGWQDIKQRYRRSALGPFWITLSLGITIAMMGLLYAKLFHQDVRTYLPYLTTGMVIWALISGIMNDSVLVFIQAEGIIKQIPLPFGVHVLRMIWRHTIIFFHNMVVVLIVLFLFRITPGWHILLFPFAMGLVFINAFWVSLLLGILGTRYRDIVQMVSNVVQILFFLTPVMWTASTIQNKRWILEFNPLYHILAIVRNTLMGGILPAVSWAVVMGITVVGWYLAFLLLIRYRSRIAFWL
jgi:ABC-2 type transport system permease protein